MSYISRNIFIQPEETMDAGYNLCLLGPFVNVAFHVKTRLVYALGHSHLPLCPQRIMESDEAVEET